MKVCARQRVKRGQPYLILYKLGGSVTASIRARLSLILSCTFFLKQSFDFKKPILTKTLAIGKFVKTNLQNYASDNL